MIKYTELHKFTHNKPMTDFLLGHTEVKFIGYAKDKEVRRNAASGGIITATLLYLLKSGKIDGAVVLKQGIPKPYLARPIIATTSEDIKKCSQSVYIPVSKFQIYDEIRKFEGNLAFVGLPEDVAYIRRRQSQCEDFGNIKYIIGPYCGTMMDVGCLESYLKANKVKGGLGAIKKLNWRAGEWPGHLRIETEDRVLKADKFYYNYLIPSYITRDSLTSIDFTNELTDLSVGDAWHPKYEKERKGFSVVLVRNKKMAEIMKEMERLNLIEVVEHKNREEVVNMHGHMIDFKKRGAFIRMKWLKFFGKEVPEYDYKPKKIPFSRYLVEFVICSIFVIGKWRISKWLIEVIPVGGIFNFLRKSWKAMSRSTKRKGIINTEYSKVS